MMKKKIITAVFSVAFFAIIVLAAIFNDPIIDAVRKDSKPNHYVVDLQGIEVIIEYVPESWTEKEYYKFIAGDYEISEEEGYTQINNKVNYTITIENKKVKVIGRNIIDAIKRFK